MRVILDLAKWGGGKKKKKKKDKPVLVMHGPKMFIYKNSHSFLDIQLKTLWKSTVQELVRVII